MHIDHIYKACNAVPADFGGGSAFDKVWVMAKLAAVLEHKTYVEIGVYRGRSFLPLARAFGLLGGFSYGIDPYDRDAAVKHDVAPNIAEAVKSFFNTTDYAAVYRGFLRSQAQLGQHRSIQRKIPRGREDEEQLTDDPVALVR